jgi:hypothetical protein
MIADDKNTRFWEDKVIDLVAQLRREPKKGKRCPSVVRDCENGRDDLSRSINLAVDCYWEYHAGSRVPRQFPPWVRKRQFEVLKLVKEELGQEAKVPVGVRVGSKASAGLLSVYDKKSCVCRHHQMAAWQWSIRNQFREYRVAVAGFLHSPCVVAKLEGRASTKQYK